MTSPNPMLRIIDVNADRAAEALRVVGDVARFLLNDETLASAWRDLRRRLWNALTATPGLQRLALENRDSAGDVGRHFPAPSHQDALALARTNVHRAQESLRVLEETFRSVDPAVVSHLAALRYQCYDEEKRLMAGLERWSAAGKLDFALYVVLGREFSQGRDFVEVSEKAIAGGAGAIQLREKEMTSRELLPWAYRLRELTLRHGVTFIINDRIDLVQAVDADGVHLGQNDFPIPEARRILGPTKLIGASTHSMDEAQRAVAEGASYINIGPIFSTNTKTGTAAPVGPDLITQVTAVVHHPFTVMGGIKLHNVDEVLQRGAQRVAVVTGVIAAEDITAAARTFVEKIRSYPPIPAVS